LKSEGFSFIRDLDWINFIDPEKLRFENQKAAKPKKQALRFSLLFDLFVTSTGLPGGDPLSSHLKIERPLLSLWFFVFFQDLKAIAFNLFIKQKNPSLR
jgi:hypothetical protein